MTVRENLDLGGEKLKLAQVPCRSKVGHAVSSGPLLGRARLLELPVATLSGAGERCDSLWEKSGFTDDSCDHGISSRALASLGADWTRVNPV